MEKDKIGIVGMGSISPLGGNETMIWDNYCTTDTLIQKSLQDSYVAQIPVELEASIKSLKQENRYYSKLDRSVLMAILASRKAVQDAQWTKTTHYGVNLSSSRGATGVFEHYHQLYLQHPQKMAHPLSSPLTTLGNIATWVAKDLGASGPTISHSITCSSSAHAFLNAMAWLKGDMIDRFLVGGTEAPLTEFTIAQMKALKIYSQAYEEESFPCRSMDLEKTQNTMVLGEGAAVCCLEKNPTTALAFIEGIGYSTEDFHHPAQISDEGKALQQSMRMAIGDLHPQNIDAIILHTPGTIQGDQSEINAVNAIFNQKIPRLTTNKWKIGHTLGASAALSVHWAILMLKYQKFLEVPFIHSLQNEDKPLKKIMVNAIGFGGNAVSLIISK